MKKTLFTAALLLTGIWMCGAELKTTKTSVEFGTGVIIHYDAVETENHIGFKNIRGIRGLETEHLAIGHHDAYQ